LPAFAVNMPLFEIRPETHKPDTALIRQRGDFDAFRAAYRRTIAELRGRYPTRDPDRWLTIAAGTDQEWAALAAIIARSGVGIDRTFASAAYRHSHRGELDELVGRWTRTQSASDEHPDAAQAEVRCLRRSGPS
jgi:crotonobetainyl-CoA:carnitine CoA-transferase CaiB-like acyl-CoA transferase